MKHMISAAMIGSLTIASVAFSPVAEARPGGCLKYGAAGAVAGHMVHHGVRGFIAGCATGMYRRHLYNKKMREQNAAPATAQPM